MSNKLKPLTARQHQAIKAAQPTEQGRVLETILPDSPQNNGGQVLYLDYDGVLHHENVYWSPKKGIYIAAAQEFTLFQHTGLLVELLRPYPAVRIVLSTSWVRVMGMTRAASYLPEELRSRAIGSTFHSQMSRTEFDMKSRGQQVYEDYLRRAPEQVLVIDDCEEGWPLFLRERLVLTDKIHGISEPKILESLAHILAQTFGPQ